MNYRGDDLDLRTPQGRSAGAAEAAMQQEMPPFAGARGRAGSTAVGRAEPIWVDDAVMTACNHAFDLAKAHRSGQVRLEHLLHAMATIDVAAEVLEARGIRVATLRRETGAMIAGELPMQPASAKGSPRRSEELEDVLRLASVRGGRRGAAAGVDDVIDAVADLDRDVPAAMLVRRLGVRSLSEPQTTYMRSATYVEPEAPRERVRMPAGSSYVDEPQRVVRAEGVPSVVDSLQNSRLDTLEQMVRALHGDVIGERKTFSTMFQDLKLQMSEQRDEQSRAMQSNAPHAAVERLKTFEIMLDNRITALDQSIKDRSTETSLEIVQLADRIKSVEDGQAAQRTQALQLNSAVAAEIRELAQRLSAQPAGAEQVQSIVGERFQSLVSTLERQRSEIGAVVNSVVAERIGTMAAPLQTLGSALEARTAETRQHLAGLEARNAEHARNLMAVGERIGAVERAMAGYVQKFAESAAAYDQDLGEMQQAMLKLNTNQQTLAGGIDQWRLDGAGDLGVVSNRLSGLEVALESQTRLMEQLGARIDSLHRATAERHEKRSRFWYWLLGTNDWIGASWTGKAVAALRPAAQGRQHPAPPPSTPRK